MRTIGIYPGQFQPPHRGHYVAYKKLRQIAGPDTFVVATDYDPTIEAPLHFGDKEQIWSRLGVPGSHIRQVKSLLDPKEVLENYDPNTTSVIYAVNKPTADKLINKSSYYKGIEWAGSKLKPYSQQAYILVVDDNLRARDKQGNQKVYTSKNIRESLGSHRFTDSQKKWWFELFFNWFDLGLFELLKNKYTDAHQSADSLSGPKDNIKETLSKEITDILNELMGQPPSIATDGNWGQTDNSSGDLDTDYTQSDAEMKKQAAAARKDLTLQKKQAEDEKKMHINQYDRDKTAAYNYNKYTRKQDQQKIDTINQQMTQNPIS